MAEYKPIKHAEGVLSSNHNVKKGHMLRIEEQSMSFMLSTVLDFMHSCFGQLWR